MFFSVIVPVYGVEKYIKRCIESVLNQTFADFELILVNDGAKDRCPEICDSYAAHDNRVKVIRKSNGGLVSARQAGMRAACGEYVFNLDGDDAMTGNALENAYNIILSTGADIISFSYICCKNGGEYEVINEAADEGLYETRDIAKKIFPKLLLDENMHHMLYYAWGKAVRRTLAEPAQLGVDTQITMGEDICAMQGCYMNAKKVYISRKTVYLYTLRNDSMSSGLGAEQLLRLEKLVSALKARNVPKDYNMQISRYYCYMCFVILAAAAENGHCRTLGDMKKRITGSRHAAELEKAEFSDITFKSRVAVSLIKKKRIYTAYCFLYLCGLVKRIVGRKGEHK